MKTAFLLFTLCLSAVLIRAESILANKQGQYAVDQIPEDLQKKAHAVVRLDKTEVILKASDNYEMKRHQVVTALSKKGEEHLVFVAGYKEGSSKVSDVEIIIYDAQGKEIKKVHRKEIEDYASSDGFSIISDYRVKVFQYKPTSYPVTIDMSYTLTSKNTYSLPRWYPIMDYNVSVEKSTYDLINQTNINIDKKELNLDRIESENTDLSYQLYNNPVVFREAYSPSALQIFPSVVFRPEVNSYEGYEASYRDWEGFGKWMYHSFLKTKKLENLEEVKRDLDAVIPVGASEWEIAQAIYEYVQENTRYVSIGLDEGGYEPLSADKVHEVKYGDCKALSWYTKELLRLYDITANYVAVHAGVDDPEDMMQDFASPFPANHAIINIQLGGDTAWVDCTSHDNPFNFLGSFTDDRVVVQIDENGGTLIRTPGYGADENEIKYTSTIELDKSAAVEAEVEILRSGLAIEGGQTIDRLDEDDFNKYVQKDLFADFDDVKITLSDRSFAEDLLYREHYRFSSSQYAEVAGDYLLIPYGLMNLKVPRLKKDSNRVTPIVFLRPYRRVVSTTYTVPEGYRLQPQEDVLIESPYGTYTRSVTLREDRNVEVHREFLLHKGYYAPDTYNEIRKAFDKIRKAEKDQFILTNKS